MSYEHLSEHTENHNHGGNIYSFSISSELIKLLSGMESLLTFSKLRRENSHLEQLLKQIYHSIPFNRSITLESFEEFDDCINCLKVYSDDLLHSYLNLETRWAQLCSENKFIRK